MPHEDIAPCYCEHHTKEIKHTVHERQRPSNVSRNVILELQKFKQISATVKKINEDAFDITMDYHCSFFLSVLPFVFTR